MLTKKDLKEIKSTVGEQIQPIHKSINTLDGKFTKLESRIASLDTKMTKKLNSMQKSLDTTISYFDTVATKHTKQIKRIEGNLNLPSLPDFI